MFTKSSLVAAAALLLSGAQAQFTCTVSGARDPDSCTAVTDDSSEHCVWCLVGGREGGDLTTAFGFCVTETQAEAIESSITNVHCDRYHGGSNDDHAITDDQAATDDQASAADDDAAPASDDAMPYDDDLPDNFWSCLSKKSQTDCSKNDGCTWCDTEAGFGLCMTGPSAESSANSDWFSCKKLSEVDLLAFEILKNPLDASCGRAFVDRPTQAGCTTAVDESGIPCQWCSLASGLSNLCLTKEQAEQGSALGVGCVVAAASTTRLRAESHTNLRAIAL